MLQVVLASVTALYALLGYWGAVGKVNWFWRATAICLGLLALIPIQAFEPLVLFAVVSIFFVMARASQQLCFWWLQRRAMRVGKVSSTPERQSSWQFHLHDLFGATAVVGIAAWMTKVVSRQGIQLDWLALFATAIVIVTATLFTHRLVVGPRRLLSGCLLLALTGSNVILFQLHVSAVDRAVYSLAGYSLGDYLLGEFVLAGISRVAILFTSFSILLFMLAGELEKSATSTLRRGVSGGIAVLLMALAVTGYGWVYAQLLGFSQPPLHLHENANAFPLVLERGQRIESVAPVQARSITGEVLKLTKQPGYVVVPWQASHAERRAFDSNLLMDVQSCRSISRGLDTQAKILESTSPDQAADHAIGILQLGGMLRHEGLLVHGLVGMAIEGVGQLRLGLLRTKMSANKARELARELEQLEERRETLEEAFVREERWIDLNDRWGYRLCKIFDTSESGALPGTTSGRQQFEISRGRYSCFSRLLATDLALRAYKSQHGEYPKNLQDLAPQYLSRVLDDSFGRPFVYRQSGSSFVLYSLGKDGVDNGGEFTDMIHVTWGSAGLDWDLDALNRP
jgi:hypothetical protein